MRYDQLNTPSRTIMTPGPVEVDPRVLRAMSTPILGQFDPAFTKLMNEVMGMQREVFQTNNHWAFPIDGTSRAGNEALLASIIEPGDKVLVPVYGRFGHLLVEICERYGAEVHSIQCPWGDVFDPQVVIEEIKKVSPKIVAIVHGETSTGRMQPLKEIGKACREQDVLLVVDAVASIGGVEVKTDEWQIDGIIGGTQKCLSVPSGMAPITFNERIEKIILERKKVEAGIATEADQRYNRSRLAIASNYFDLSMLMDYWSPRRLNHHTEATSMIYALHEGLRLVLEEGLNNRFARHKLHEKALVAGIEAMGLNLFGDARNKLPCVTCVEIPTGVDGESVRTMLLEEFSIEIASSFGPLHGKIWRIGTMGYSCRKENVLAVLGALEAVLIRHYVSVNRGEALQAALDVYAAEGKKTVAL
jgi:(S)-ureidoglycine---glyoxylate transaminase